MPAGRHGVPAQRGAARGRAANVYFGSQDGNVYAVNAATGTEVYSFPNVGMEISSPAVANGIVYVGGASGALFANNARTGNQVWNVGVGPGAAADSSPAVANGAVYVGSGDGSLYAFDASTGARLWSAATGSSVLSSPAVSDGTVYVGSENGTLYAYNLGAAAQGPRRPRPGSLHPDLRLRYQKGGARG